MAQLVSDNHIVAYTAVLADISLTQEAYKAASKLRAVKLKRRWSLEAQEDAVLKVLSVLYDREIAEVAPAPAPSSANVLVCVAEQNEAISGGFILQQMVQRYLQSVTFLVRSPSQVEQTKAMFALVILSKGILEDTSFAQTLLAIRCSD